MKSCLTLIKNNSYEHQNKPKSTFDVIVYHDETKGNSFCKRKGHIFLFVPERAEATFTSPLFGKDVKKYSPFDLLYKEICKIKQDYNITEHKLHFTNISGSRWYKSDVGYRIIIETSVDALRHKSSQIFNNNSLSCKLAAIFYPNPSRSDLILYGGKDKKEKSLRYDETIMRMLLKGALNYLYSNENKVHITNLYTDGRPEFRPLDEKRIIRTLLSDEEYGRSPLQKFVSFDNKAKIIPLSSDHKDHIPTTADYKHATFLQLADFLLGAIIKSCYSNTTRHKNLPQIGDVLANQDKKAVVAYPVMEMLEKKEIRKANFKNSGHFKAFSLAELTFKDSVIDFKELKVQDIAIFSNTPEFDFAL